MPSGGFSPRLRCSARLGAGGFKASVVVGVRGNEALGVGLGEDLAAVVIGEGGIAGWAVGGGFAFYGDDVFYALDDLVAVDGFLAELVGNRRRTVRVVADLDFSRSASLLAGNGTALVVISPCGDTNSALVGDASEQQRVAGRFVVVDTRCSLATLGAVAANEPALLVVGVNNIQPSAVKFAGAKVRVLGKCQVIAQAIANRSFI